jgi:hypothetical protein
MCGHISSQDGLSELVTSAVHAIKKKKKSEIFSGRDKSSNQEYIRSAQYIIHILLIDRRRYTTFPNTCRRGCGRLLGAGALLLVDAVGAGNLEEEARSRSWLYGAPGVETRGRGASDGLRRGGTGVGDGLRRGFEGTVGDESRDVGGGDVAGQVWKKNQ